jgi:6-pyruvoyltetrahydropterin 2'-reductase
MREKSYKYSEIFGHTIQGEGAYTGRPTVWVRFWGCNFNCSGFGQDNPTDPTTWKFPHFEGTEQYTSLDDLPVFKFGCDSSYSWSKLFAHLAQQSTAEEICNKLTELLKSPSNPEGRFCHSTSKQWTHMAFTGGEPMMSQTAIIDILNVFFNKHNYPKYVTIETNGTQMPRDAFKSMMFYRYKAQVNGAWPAEWYWSISPKLSASGEKWEDAIQPEVVAEYQKLSSKGQLKYVVDGSDRCWDEVARATAVYREAGVNFPVWIMPVGSKKEQQEDLQAQICEECFRRGYNFSARVHSWIFDNSIGK